MPQKDITYDDVVYARLPRAETYLPFWAAEIPEACACAACEAPYDDK